MNIQTLIQSALALVPETALILGALLILLLSSSLKRKQSDAFCALSVVTIAVAFVFNFSRFSETTTAFSGAVITDSFSAYFNSIFLISALATVFLSRDHLRGKSQWVEEFYALVLLCACGMMVLASSVELMTLFVGFEIMSIAVYILSGFMRKSEGSIESGVKYLVLGGFSSAILLLGIAFLYGACGSTFLAEIVVTPSENMPMYICGIAFTAVGVFFKIGAVPLHQWVPDIYEGAPLTVAGYMSVAVKAAAFIILFRILTVTHAGIENYMETAIQVLAILTMVVGNVAAIYQKSIKRMLAYSSVAHAGYALVGVAAFVSDASVGAGSVLYYLLAYSFMNLGAFAILAYASAERNDCDSFERISGLWKRRPAASLGLCVFMFSLAGIPPTIGFFGKYRVFSTAVDAGLAPLAVIGILASIVSVYYYLRVLVYAFMKEDSYGAGVSKPLSGITITALAAASVFFGIFPLLSWNLAVQASGALALVTAF